MAKNNPNPTDLAIPKKSGTPKNRLTNAYQAWEIAKSVDEADEKRAKKRSRMWKAYHRFPPREYSLLAQEGADWQSNTPFGMLSYTVDNNISSFYDMVTERTLAAQIKTEKGDENQKQEWSDHISVAFDMILRSWDDFLLNVEQDLLDMGVVGKGIQIWEDEEGCVSEHCPADDFLVPDGTKISLKNFDFFVIRKKYSLHELWEKIEGGGEQRGWRKQAVLNAMMYQRESWIGGGKEPESKFVNDVVEGNITLASHLKESVNTYQIYIKEFKLNGKSRIGKYIVLQDYDGPFSLTRTEAEKKRQLQKDEYEQLRNNFIKKEGFLFAKDNFAECVGDFVSVFIENAGRGYWNTVVSLAEKIFVQCRQYDFIMNAVMDAVKINMSLMIQASNAEATEKIKSLVFGPYVIIPSDTPFVQQRVALPTTEATNAVQFMMLDMFRGIGEYRIHERASGGQPVTATQNQNDTAESARISNTQLKRYNEQHSQYYRKFYRKLVSLKSGEKDYDMLKRFKKYLKSKGVPTEAWKWENIESINSNMLMGAGSPSYKIMAAKETIGLLNISPKSSGQANAIKDAIAHLNGRSNVERYWKDVTPDKEYDTQLAGFENEMLSNPFANGQNVQVMPHHSDLNHLQVHMSDLERIISLVNEMLDSGQVDQITLRIASFRMLNILSHSQPHLHNLYRDEGKKDQAKEAAKRLADIQKAINNLMGKVQKAMESQNEEFDPSSDPDVMKRMALSQIEIDTKQKLSNIKLFDKASSHEQKMEALEDRAAQQIAIDRAKAAASSQNGGNNES